MSFAVAASSCTQCSTESTPARTAPVMPGPPIAWAPTPTRHLWASSTAAPISSGVMAVKVASMPGVSTPPVAITLIARAPPLICSRTALRASSAPSTSRAMPMLCPCPPVIVSARPAAITRGPSMTPSSTAAARSHVPTPPRSRTVVTPAARCLRRFRTPCRTAVSRRSASVGLEIGTTVEVQMDVAIDKTGRERFARRVDHACGPRGAGSAGMGADPRDAVSLDEHAGVPPDARAVEEGHVCDVEGPRHLKTPTAERRRCHRPGGSVSCRRASSRRSSRPRARPPPNGPDREARRRSLRP